MITEQQRIRAVGNFLSYYESDLKYIKKFSEFISGTITFDEYVRDTPYSFMGFLAEFKIIRGISKYKQDDLLKEIKKWSKNDSPGDVDRLAERLMNRGYSFDKRPLSLSSKITFLINPKVIIPLDRRGKKAMKIDKVSYVEYLASVDLFRMDNIEVIKRGLSQVKEDAQLVEKSFKDIGGLKQIRENRMVDKLLWVKGGFN